MKRFHRDRDVSNKVREIEEGASKDARRVE